MVLWQILIVFMWNLCKCNCRLIIEVILRNARCNNKVYTKIVLLNSRKHEVWLQSLSIHVITIEFKMPLNI